MTAMYQALTMSDEERAQRAATLAQIVEREDILHWIICQLEDIKALI